MGVAALDVGDARIGVAVADDLGVSVRGIGVLRRKGGRHDLAAIERLLAGHGVSRVVVGLPLNMDGSEGRQAARVRAFGERLARHLGMPVDYWDERLTTFEAESKLRAAGVSAARRRALIDQVAAEVILRAYLDHRA
ncbi:MAG TPA: Holliday junction resolvase RuvX [Candidatus Limnocylindria bacterium]|nr:Holliday junction resolvase RuvX [Candidatus Limnocylindria bacterium]